MTTLHKHAEILNAIAQGKEVEYYSNSSQQWVKSDLVNLNPISNYQYEWRIKPEKKPDIKIYEYAYLKTDNNMFLLATCCPNVVFTFSSDTKELINVELVK